MKGCKLIIARGNEVAINQNVLRRSLCAVFPGIDPLVFDRVTSVW